MAHGRLSEYDGGVKTEHGDALAVSCALIGASSGWHFNAQFSIGRCPRSSRARGELTLVIAWLVRAVVSPLLRTVAHGEGGL
jgi:hypothetical protein